MTTPQQLINKQTENQCSYELYRELWDSAYKIDYVQKVPLHIDLEVNTKCNYKCKKCYHSHEKIPSIEMDFEFAKKIIEEFANKGGYSIKFVYRGEPLLYDKLFSLICYSKDKGILDTFINSNGSLLTREKSIDLIKSGLDQVIFSIDTCNYKLYRSLQPGATLEKVKTNLLTLVALKQLIRSNTPKITIQRVEYGSKEPLQEDFEVYKDYWLSFDQSLIVLNQPLLDLYNTTERDDIKGRCPELWRRLVIRADGKVQFCCGTPTQSKIIGDLYKKTLEEIWNSESLNYYRKLMKMGRIDCIMACKTCNQYPINGGVK